MPGRQTRTGGTSANAYASARRTIGSAGAALDRGRATAHALQDAITRGDYAAACALGFEVRSTISRLDTALAAIADHEAADPELATAVRDVRVRLELFRADVAEVLAHAPRIGELGAGTEDHERAWRASVGAPDPFGGRDVAHEDGSASGPRVARLHLLIDVDVEDMTPWLPHRMIGDLASGLVGHAWISLEYGDPATVPDHIPAHHRELMASGASRYANPIGFWPKQHGTSVNPLDSLVPGEVRHPDRAHEGAERAVQTWELTQAQVDAVIAFVESRRGAKYSTYSNNCTTFARDALLAAGLSPPAMTMFGICMPNAAFAALRAHHRQGGGGTTIPLRPTRAEPEPTD